MSELGFKVPPTGHKVTETGPRFKVSSERPKKWGIDLAIPGLVVLGVIHYTTAAPSPELKKLALLTWQYILKREDGAPPQPFIRCVQTTAPISARLRGNLYHSCSQFGKLLICTGH